MKPTRSVPAPPDAHGPLTVRVLTDLTERQRFDALLEAEHFLGPRFPAGDRLYQVAEQDGQWVGLLLWCASALHLKDRDAWIGWDPLTRAQRLKLIVNNARFLVPDRARRPNLASQILAAATKTLPDQWFAQHGYAPLLAETFTDPEAHAGTCYKAAGWIPVGKTAGFQRHRCDFFAFHDHSKRLWLQPLDPQAKAKLCAPDLYPRHAPALTIGAAARSALNAAQRSSLKDALRQVPDPRRKQGQRYPLAPCLVVLALGLLAGKRDLAELQRFGTRLSQAQRKALGFWPKKGTKFYPAPTYNVLRDLLIALDLDAFAAVLTRWLQSQVGILPASLALDGKTIRDHLGCMVSLVEHEDGAPAALISAPNKGHELPAVQHLLRSPRRQPPGLRRHRRPSPLPERNRPNHYPGKRWRLRPQGQRQPTHRPEKRRTETLRPHPPFAQTEPSRGRIETRAVSSTAIEPDALPFPDARQVFDTRNTST